MEHPAFQRDAISRISAGQQPLRSATGQSTGVQVSVVSKAGQHLRRHPGRASFRSDSLNAEDGPPIARSRTPADQAGRSKADQAGRIHFFRNYEYRRQPNTSSPTCRMRCSTSATSRPPRGRTIGGRRCRVDAEDPPMIRASVQFRRAGQGSGASHPSSWGYSTEVKVTCYSGPDPHGGRSQRGSALRASDELGKLVPGTLPYVTLSGVHHQQAARKGCLALINAVCSRRPRIVSRAPEVKLGGDFDHPPPRCAWE
jgi:hypothetical protein